jgi:SPP1 family predicted phage head-tail adaptor
MISSGLMRERVTIQAPSEQRNQFGEATVAWSDVATVWASVQGMSAREYLAAQQVDSVVTHKVRIRFFPGITHSHRLVWRGRIMEIASVLERETRTVHELLVKEDE